jgi:hypothetical protein
MFAGSLNWLDPDLEEVVGERPAYNSIAYFPREDNPALVVRLKHLVLGLDLP